MKLCPFCEHRFERDDWQCPSCGRQPEQGRFTVLAPALEEFSASFDPEVFADLADLEVGHPWFEARNELVVWVITKFFPSAKDLLEVGCGVGTVLAALGQATPQLSLTGADAFPPCLDIASRRLNGVELLQLDANRLPFEREYDLVCFLDVLEHMDDDEKVLAEAFRTLRPGGGLIIAVPQHRWLWSAADDFALHRRRYRKRDLLDVVRAAGFELVHSTSFVTTLLPVLLVSRLVQRRIDSYDPRNELTPSRFVRSVLRVALSVDLAAIRRGVRLPVGGSLLMVARRPAEIGSAAAHDGQR